MHISVTVMTTASVVTALLEVATTFSSVYIAVTLMCSAMLLRCHCRRRCTVVSLHRYTNVAAIPETAHRCNNTVTTADVTLMANVTTVTVWTVV